VMKMLMNISNFDLFSEMFGELWDMFWHHHWCLRNYLEPLTIILFERKINRSKKMENPRTVILH
jgi:hypothetical protein